MEALSRITLDLLRPSYETVYAAPLDCDSRGVIITLLAGSQAWTPPGGASAAIEVRKPDGSLCVYDTLEDGETSAYTISGNTITILWAQQALTAAGQAMVALRFYNAAGKKLSTFTFRLVIPAGAVSDAEIESTDYFSLFTRQAAVVLAASVHSPTINATNLHWMLWDSETGAYVDSGYRAIIHSDAEQAEAWAVGQRGGEDVASDDETYHNNAKYYSGQAAGSAHTAGQQASAASTSAGTAGTKALAAEGYALGTQNGVDVASGSPYYHHNAKYYAELAAALTNAGYDLEFDDEEQMLYLLDISGERLGNGAEIHIGIDGISMDTETDEDDNVYLVLYDGEGEELARTQIPAGGGGGGAVSSVTLSNVVKPSSVRNGANAVFSFTAISSDDTNITANWYVDGILRATASDRASGSSFSFNAKDYLKPSNTSTVSVVVTSEGGALLRRQWDVTSTAFSLSWGAAIQPVTLYTANENVYAVVNVSAQARTQNAVTVSIGNHDIERTVTGSTSVTFEINKAWFSSGVNTITATMVSGTDPNDAADPISYKAIWGYSATDPIVAFAAASQSVSQYDIAPIQFMVYDPDHETASATLQVGTDAARSLSANRTLQTLNYVPQDYGTKTVTLSCGVSSTTMTLVIAQSEYDIGMITGDNLRYSLDPMGHSNTDADRASFGNLVFSAGFDWVNGGFHADANGAPAFVVKKGNRATLPRQLFGDADSNGKTIDVSFRITNSDLYQAVAMQELNNGESKGLILRANEGELRLNNTTGQLFRYCEDSRIDMSINVEAINDHRVMTVWLDGIPSQVHKYTANTLVQDESALVIGSDHCDVWIYAIRVYNSALSNREMIQNYISLGSTTEEKVERCQVNDVFDDNGVITPATLHAAMPDLTIVQISAERMTTGKKDPVDAVITIQDGSTVLTLDSGTKFQVQGTSSSAYGRSAYNLDLDFKNSGKTYALSAGAIPVSYINIKVNVASSENANNICAADMYNSFQPYLVPARATAGVRDTVEGKPCAVFFTNTSSNTIWIGSQQLRPGDTVLYAMGDICNSKKNTAVFGQGQTGEHYSKGCIEVSGNDTQAQQFKASSTYDASADDGKGEWHTTSGGKTSLDYEWRTKPKTADVTEVVTAWDDAVAWVVSTIGDSAKFKAEVGDYFAIDSLLYHFLWLEFYSAFDNVSKNTFYSYDWDEAAGKYLWNICKNYDDDTILGCDNDGVPLADYGADFGDTAGARSLFNADENTIWVNIQEAYYTELAAMYITLRGRGAWDAGSIIRKWDTYQGKRPHAAMAEDAFNKYILPYKTTGVIVVNEEKSYDDSYLARLQGSKTYQRRQFLTYQAKYMDGKYGYYNTSSSIAFRANAPAGTTEDLTVSVYAKTYVTVIVDNGTKVSKKIATGGSAVFQNTAVHSNATIYVTPESLINSITPIDGINNSTFSAAGASKLQDVTLGSAESENTAWDANTGLSIPSVLLKALSIRNITNFASALDLSANVELESVDTRGTQAGMITLPSYAPLEAIHLNACSGITALNLNAVTAFSLTNGNLLTSVHVENCNSIVNDAMYGYLVQAVAAGGNATRRIRMTGVAWHIADLNTLYAIATKWKGYDSMGQEQNAPVITGSITADSWSQAKLDVIESVFGAALVITCDPSGEVPNYTVTFLNYNDAVLLTQTVEQGDPPVPPATDPARESSDSTVYTFDGWSYTNGGSKIADMDAIRITSNTAFYAHYAESPRVFTVNWYSSAGASGELLDSTTVSYGQEAVYSGEIPVSPNDGALAAYYLFKGWDKSTGYVKSDLSVYAQYDSATAPSSGSLSDFSPEQLKALIGEGVLSSTGANNTLVSSGDTIDIVAGHDYSFSNVTQHELISPGSPQTFDGATSYKPQINSQDILLFNEDKSWTLAVDFAYDTSSAAGGCLAACYHSNGFLLRYASGGSVRYGSTTAQAVSSNGVRQIVVIRKKAGDGNLYVYASNKNGNAIQYAALTQSTLPSHTAPLAFGARIANDGLAEDYGKGTVYWAKLWDDDLGDTVCRDLVSWPRQTFTMQAVGSSQYAFRNFVRVDNAHYVNCAFLLKDLLEETRQMNTSNSNVGGWKAMPIRTWLNNRIMNALPIKWQQLLLTVYVHSTEGNQKSTLVDPPAEDKIWLPSIKEIGSQTGSPYSAESEAVFTVFTNDASRIKKLNLGSGAASNWWTRSPFTGNNVTFWFVSPSGGTSGSYAATSSCGVAFGFCI